MILRAFPAVCATHLLYIDVARKHFVGDALRYATVATDLPAN